MRKEKKNRSFIMFSVSLLAVLIVFVASIARMICVADSFDAMNSNRVYRKKLTTEMIIAEIENNKGKQFDPQIADVFLGLLRDGKIEGFS